MKIQQNPSNHPSFCAKLTVRDCKNVISNSELEILRNCFEKHGTDKDIIHLDIENSLDRTLYATHLITPSITIDGRWMDLCIIRAGSFGDAMERIMKSVDTGVRQLQGKPRRWESDLDKKIDENLKVLSPSKPKGIFSRFMNYLNNRTKNSLKNN